MSLRTLAAALVAAALFAVPAAAHEVTVGALTITDLWSRATPPKAPTAAGFMTITNNGQADDTLVSVSSPVAKTAELHMMEMQNGVMKMHPVAGGIVIPAGKSVTLAPSGYHVMFITLNQDLKEGGKLPVTLTFAKAGSVDTFLHILSIGATGPTGSSGSGGGMDMQHMDHSNDMGGAGQ